MMGYDLKYNTAYEPVISFEKFKNPADNGGLCLTILPGLYLAGLDV